MCVQREKQALFSTITCRRSIQFQHTYLDHILAVSATVDMLVGMDFFFNHLVFLPMSDFFLQPLCHLIHCSWSYLFINLVIQSREWLSPKQTCAGQVQEGKKGIHLLSKNAHHQHWQHQFDIHSYVSPSSLYRIYLAELISITSKLGRLCKSNDLLCHGLPSRFFPCEFFLWFVMT